MITNSGGTCFGRRGWINVLTRWVNSVHLQITVTERTFTDYWRVFTLRNIIGYKCIIWVLRILPGAYEYMFQVLHNSEYSNLGLTRRYKMTISRTTPRIESMQVKSISSYRYDSCTDRHHGIVRSKECVGVHSTERKLGGLFLVDKQLSQYSVLLTM